MTLRIPVKPDVKWGPRPGPRVGLRHRFAASFVRCCGRRGQRFACVVRTVGDRLGIEISGLGGRSGLFGLYAAALRLNYVIHIQLFG